jgi:hypothetical protein
LPSGTTKTDDEFTIKSMYTALMDEDTFGKLEDKGEYILKFITSGAYPVFEFDSNSIARKMVEVAANRGDCTAIIDHTPNHDRTMVKTEEASLYKNVSSFVESFIGDETTYAAMFTPYCVYNCASVNK